MRYQHKARRLVLQGLCCLDVQGEKSANLVREFVADSRESSQVIAAAQQLLRQVWSKREDCDRLVMKHAKHWEMKRLAMVDRNILRLSVCEMLNGDAPMKVIISEAIRLAKEFASAESPRFVNGILDAVYREISSDIAPPENHNGLRRVRGSENDKDDEKE